MALVNCRTRRFTRDEYYRMADTGVLRSDERVELIDGEIVSMPPQNLRHATGISMTNMRLTAAFANTHIVRCQCPLTLSDQCEPEPDFALVTPTHFQECAAKGIHPNRPDLIVEVADRSLGYDRGEKVGVYARAGVPEYWLLNVTKRYLEERREPIADPDSPFGFSYRSIRIVREHESVSPLFAPERFLLVADLLVVHGHSEEMTVCAPTEVFPTCEASVRC